MVKNLQCRRLRFDPRAGKIPWRRAWQPHSRILAWRSLADYSPWGCTEMDTTEVTKRWAGLRRAVAFWVSPGQWRCPRTWLNFRLEQPAVAGGWGILSAGGVGSEGWRISVEVVCFEQAEERRGEAPRGRIQTVKRLAFENTCTENRTRMRKVWTGKELGSLSVLISAPGSALNLDAVLPGAARLQPLSGNRVRPSLKAPIIVSS